MCARLCLLVLKHCQQKTFVTDKPKRQLAYGRGKRLCVTERPKVGGGGSSACWFLFLHYSIPFYNKLELFCSFIRYLRHDLEEKVSYAYNMRPYSSSVTPLGEGQQQARHLLKHMWYVTGSQITDVLLCAEYLRTLLSKHKEMRAKCYTLFNKNVNYHRFLVLSKTHKGLQI